MQIYSQNHFGITSDVYQNFEPFLKPIWFSPLLLWIPLSLKHWPNYAKTPIIPQNTQFYGKEYLGLLARNGKNGKNRNSLAASFWRKNTLYFLFFGSFPSFSRSCSNFPVYWQSFLWSMFNNIWTNYSKIYFFSPKIFL